MGDTCALRIFVLTLGLCLTACSVDAVQFSAGPPPPLENCAVMGDEDGNGLADCADVACVADSTCIAMCGNGAVDSGESCDDGAISFGDGCDATCTPSAAFYVKAANTGPSDNFGHSLALSADALTLSVGAIQEDSGSAIDMADDSLDEAGAAYVYSRTAPNQWTHEAYVKPSNPGFADVFGWNVSLSGDGRTLVATAPGEASNSSGVNGSPLDNSLPSAGAAYVFLRTPTGWLQNSYIKASNPDADDQFGHSAALSGDGQTLVIGAHREDSSARLIDGDQADNAASSAGAAYVFYRSGSSWIQQAYLKAPNADPNDQFGRNVAVSFDGSLVAIAAPLEASSSQGVSATASLDNTASGAGAVHLFRRTGTAWSYYAYVKASNTSASDLFGSCVALSPSGNLLIVGAPNEDSSSRGVNGLQFDDLSVNSGAAYTFRRAGDSWSQIAFVKSFNSDPGDSFGSSCAVGDAHFAVGAPGESSSTTGLSSLSADNPAANAGAVCVFSASPTVVGTASLCKISNTEAQDIFGARAVALSQRRMGRRTIYG
ncbi:MAG: integrin [Myxococcales bacterium]|nr:integrin [Myxococcales bacterium]